MKKLKSVLILLFLSMLFNLACGGGGINEDPTVTAAAVEIAPTNTAEPTATPAPTNTPEPTATPAPTNTPEPTATPENTGFIIPDGFQPIEFTEEGVSFYYPSDWANRVAYGGWISIATDDALLFGSLDDEGAVAMVVTDGIRADSAQRDFEFYLLSLDVEIDDSIQIDLCPLIISELDALTILTTIINDPDLLNLGTNIEVVKSAEKVTTVNEGYDVATTVLARDENNLHMAYVLTIILTDTRFGLFLGVTPVDTLEQYEGTLRAIGNSIILSERVVANKGNSASSSLSSCETETVVEDIVVTTDLVIGTTEGELPTGESEQSFLFFAAGGETLTFLLTPGNNDMDVVIEIYDLTDLDSTVAEIDSGFSGEEETLTYTFTTPGIYVIIVSEFYGEGGPYTLLVTQ